MSKDQQSEIRDWKRMWFKENKAWMATDAQGMPVSKDGKVLIKYQIKQDYEYWVNKNNVRPLDSPPTKSLQRSKGRSHHQKSGQGKYAADKISWDEAECKEKICLFTDGASSGNPGPSGIGVLMRYGEHTKEISTYIGKTTNNIAELKAIEAALSALKKTDIPVRLFTDSKYAYGLLVLNWKARKNQKLVESIKRIMEKFQDLEIIKVRGHSGHPGNERADYLATSAIKQA